MKAKPVSVNLILITIVLLLISMPLIAQDDEIPSPDFTILVDGESVQGELDISTINSAMVYAFVAVEGDSVTIAMGAEDTELLDPYLILYGPSGQVLAINDDVDYDGGDFNAEIEDFEIEETGFHFVVATTTDLIYELTYEFGVDANIHDGEEDMQSFDIVVEGNSQPEELTVPPFIVLEQGGEVEVEISEEMPIRFVVFSAESDSTIILTTFSDDVDTLLYLFAPDGRQLAINDDLDFESGISDSEIVIDIEDDGVYMAVVAAVDHLVPLTLEGEIVNTGMVAVTLE